MIARADIVAEARSWIGTPFHHQASIKGAGADCIGLLHGVARPLGLQGVEDFGRAMLAEFAGYGRDPNPDLLRVGCSRYFERVAPGDLDLGDVLLFQMPMSRGEPKHFGIVSGVSPLYMVHSWAGGKSRVVENRVDESWRRRILACYRFKGVE